VTTDTFVVWDFTIDALQITLESLQDAPPDGHRVRVPGLSRDAGTILFDVVMEGIEEADRVLVVTDKPNANVGFEAGVALALGKSMLFAHYGHELPEWSSRPPLRNYLQNHFTDIVGLEELLLDEDAWWSAPAATALPEDGPCLDLCPRQGEGAALRRRRERMELDDWMRPPDSLLLLTELEDRLGDAARLVWTIANFGEGADERDGAENAINGLFAGWFFGRPGPDASARAERFKVLRSASSRRIADVHLFEKEFGTLKEYAQRIRDFERAWAERAEERTRRERRSRLRGVEEDPSTIRVAVLAFRDLGAPDEDDGYSEGFTEWVIDDLAAIADQHPGLDVVPRRDVIVAENQTGSIAEIGEELRAQYVLEGAFDRSRDPCQFSARLIDVARNRYLAPERFSETWRFHDLASARISRYVRDSLLPGRDSEEPRAPTRQRPEREHAAIMALWNGQSNRRQFNNLRLDEYFFNAERYFRRALEIEPGYVEALSELGFLYILRWETDSAEEWLEKSRRMWKRVRRNEDEHPVALVELGYLSYVRKGSARKAVRLARRAVESDPEHPIAHNVLALLYLYLGFYESNVLIERDEVFHRALGYIYPYANAALALQLSGRYEEALELAREARRMESNAMVAVLMEGAQHYYLEEMDEAERVWREGLEVCPPAVKPILEVALAWIAARGGNRASAERVVEEHRDAAWLSGPYGPYFASLCALTGERDLAVELLAEDRTFASSYRYLVSERTLRPLFGHPRFARLLEKRYGAWERNLEQLGAGLPAAPARQPSPREVLEERGG